MLSSSCITLTCEVIGWNKQSSNKNKYEVKSSVYGLTSEVLMMTIVMEVNTITVSDILQLYTGHQGTIQTLLRNLVIFYQS